MKEIKSVCLLPNFLPFGMPTEPKLFLPIIPGNYGLVLFTYLCLFQVYVFNIFKIILGPCENIVKGVYLLFNYYLIFNTNRKILFERYF